MPSNKLARTNDDIQFVLSRLIPQVKDPRVQQGMISVVSVDTSGDLRWCKVCLSVYGLKDEKEFKKGIRSASGWLRREVGNALSLRYTPEFVFILDDSIAHGAHISKMLADLEVKEDGDEASDS